VANIFCGFLAIIESTRGHLHRAGVLILCAIIADILDGRIARLTGTTSSFGAVYDSLADVISFGAAPALLVYYWGLSDIRRLRLAIAFLFLVAGSIRLARFSSTLHDIEHFKGLPIPAGAGAIAMLVLISPQPTQHPNLLPVVAVFTFALSLLMVSNLPYRSFKDLNLNKQRPAPVLFVIALIFSVFLLTPFAPFLLAGMLTVYILSAPFLVFTGRVRHKRISDLPFDAVASEGASHEPSQHKALPDRPSHPQGS